MPVNFLYSLLVLLYCYYIFYYSNTINGYFGIALLQLTMMVYILKPYPDIRFYAMPITLVMVISYFIIRAGLPTTVVFAEIDFVTTAPAPITAFSPTSMSPKIIA